MKLFFGCSKADKEFVGSLMSYLYNTYSIELEQMYNCYVGKNPVGENYNDYIRNAIKGCDRAIIVVSPESMKRKYCLCELGAAWGLEKNTILIMVAPATYSDLSESPFSGIQAWSINMHSHSSISEFIECIKKDKMFSMINRKSVNGINRTMIDDEFKDNLYTIGQMQMQIPQLPDYMRSWPFHADGNSETLRLFKEQGKITAKLDFSTSNPSFAGFYFDLRDADWRGLISNNCSLSFRIEALPTIKAVSIEFKNKKPADSLNKFGEYDIKLSGNPAEEVIDLRSISDKVDDWEHMKELTFVFHNYAVDQMGSFTLSALSFGNLPEKEL